MRIRRWGFGLALGAFAAMASLALAMCGARTPLLVPEPGDATTEGDAVTADARDAGDAYVVDLCADAAPLDAGCDGPACDFPDCGAASTTLSGVVYDPAGARPVYDVFVYVPSRPLEPMGVGPVCATCQAAASGGPIASAVTDTLGRFTLTNVPAGPNVPVVMQIGKWRRKVDVRVQACQPNVVDDPSRMRLPRSAAEGDIPLIALSTGCDDVQCFLQRTLGLAASEFTGPSGPGRVHVYRSPHGGDPVIPDAGALGDPYALWGDLEAMRRYDIVFNACECSVYGRTVDPNRPAEATMKKYLEGGGRLFATHYHFNWFSEPDGPLDFRKQAPWLGNNGAVATPPFLIDTSHPRGQALAEWLVAVGATTTLGEIGAVDVRYDVGGLNGGKPGHGAFTNTTQWIYHPNNQTLYLSFNTPTGNPPTAQCGRAVFSDVHLSGDHIKTTLPFPAYCTKGNEDHRTNELSLEFLFFDLASCVQDDTQTPRQPCQK